MKFIFDGQTLDLERRELRRAGELVAAEPQVFDLLVYLIRNRDRVVTKDDLISAVWGGRIVSESTLTSRINAARKAVGDSGDRQTLIRTVPRKGLRFVGAVQDDSSPADGRVDAPPVDAPPQMIADRPSIAVLPFENLSDDRSLELTVNGLAEDIIALLARVPGFFVIARASSFVYVKRTAEFRQIGSELGVRYLVTGSARSSDNRVRISVQLVEAESGNQLWAGRYDVERSDTLDLQDEIARQIIVELEPALTKAEFSSVRRRRTESVDAWSHFRQGVGTISVRGWHEESVAEATQEMRQAISIDPNFALARALLALLRAFGALMSVVNNIVQAQREALEEAERAIALDPNASDVLGFAGCALADIGDTRGIGLLQRAIELDPSNAQAHVALGAAYIRAGRFDDGIVSMQYGMRSSPKDFRLTFWSMILADALSRAGRLDEALELSSTASVRDGRLFGARVVSAVTLQRLNRTEDARRALAEARRIRPKLNLEEINRFFGTRAVSDLAPIWT